MIVEILFSEACNLYGDGQNVSYLQATLPEAEFVFTALTDEPYFVSNTPDLIYIGGMSESLQRRVIKKLMPYRERILDLIDGDVPILATGNAGEIFCKRIEYLTEKIVTDGIGIFDLTVKTDLFKRYNGKVLGELNGMEIIGFRSQFSFIYGDNENCHFIKCIRGVGINKESKLEGLRKNNLICTHLLGPILPYNPEFCEYFIGLSGYQAVAAYEDAATALHEQRVLEFRDPKVIF